MSEGLAGCFSRAKFAVQSVLPVEMRLCEAGDQLHSSRAGEKGV